MALDRVSRNYLSQRRCKFLPIVSRTKMIRVISPLFITGDPALGSVMSEDEVSYLSQDMKNAKISRIEGVGHLLHLQDLGQKPVMDEAMSFLADCGKVCRRLDQAVVQERMRAAVESQIKLTGFR